MMPSSISRSRDSMFAEFCKHDWCVFGGNVTVGNLSLAVPLSNFVNNCDRIWIGSLLQMKDGINILEDCSLVNHRFQEKRLLYQPIRRILRSKEIGVSLLGNLKISLATGRLQYVDATGSIDAVIPDLPSSWNMNAIYEVIDYSLVLEGRPEIRGQKWILDDDFFSCGSMFRSVSLARQTELGVYVHFAWSNVICRDFCLHDPPSSKDSTVELEHGTFHLLRLSHKFPVQSRFHGDLLISGKSFSYAEAIVLPCDLIIVSSDQAALPTSITQHELEKSYQSDFAFKRCKTDHASSFIKEVKSNSSSQHGNVSSGHASCFKSLPHKTRSVNHFTGTSPVQIPCTVTVSRTHGQSVAVSGMLSSTHGDVNSEIHQLTNPRTVLLEFNSKNLFKYKLLHIGGYYIMKHCEEKCFCDSNNMNSGSKVVVKSETYLWSLPYHSNAILWSSSLCHNHSFDSCSICESSDRHYLENEILLHPCGAADHVSFYDVSLHVTADATSLLDFDLQALTEAMQTPSVMSRDLCSIVQEVHRSNTVVSFFQSQGTNSGNCLPQGNLITVVGTVVRLHSGCCAVNEVSCNGGADDVHLLRFTHGGKLVICLHVLIDSHMVQIDGSLSKHNYPVGLGPGADVTFHRVHALRGQNRLMLTPVSILTVNSVREIPSPAAHSFRSVHEEIVASCSISGLIQCDVCNPRRFCCRVVAIHIVLLERNRDLDNLPSDIPSKKPVAGIPLAGFFLDDGSSQCCCWANGERAATFLRLHEEMPQVGFGSCWWRSVGAGKGKACSTPNSHLDKILMRHGRVTLKNCGSLHETLCQDLQLSVGSDYVFGIQDEHLLKSMIFNACSSTSLSVIGHVMDSSAIKDLEKYLPDKQMNMHALKNVWATEVCQVNTVADARALYQDL